MEDTREVIFLHLPTTQSTQARSISPLSPAHSTEKSIGFFHALSRRFGNRRSHESLRLNGEDDSHSSSTDSCSSISPGSLNRSRTQSQTHTSNLEISCSGSETSSSSSTSSDSVATGNATIEANRRLEHRRSTSSIRRAFKHLSLSSRSLSCSNTLPLKDKPKKIQKTVTPPKRILRQPVSYTYLKGMSGLPTQRVPRSAVCCQFTHHR